MDQLLTISQLAKYVGVTVRAVRHYHALKLLPEPQRDGSGYRRYGADAVIRLTRIKTLVDAGVPLSQVETLMEASDDTFAAAVASIKSNITKRITELESAKQRLDTLQSGDRMFVSEAVADYLKYLRVIGLSDEMVSLERDAWILVGALYPKDADKWVRQKQKTLADNPDTVSLYRRLDEAIHWSPDDPRIVELAKDMLRMLGGESTSSAAGYEKMDTDKQASSLVSQHGLDVFPSLKRLQEVLEELEKN